MSKLHTMEKVVLKVLEEQPETRKDDYLLMLAVCEETEADIIGNTFKDAMLHHKMLKIPNWETVTRCRRKIQEKRPDLVSPKTARKRRKEEEKYRKYARTS